MSPRSLFLIRHAKSSWSCDVDDHVRPLSGRGRRDAAALGRHLHRRGIVPDLVWLSDAVRAVQTWQIAAANGADAIAVAERPELYHATSEDLLAQLRTAPENARTVLVVGHNDGLADCVSLLGAHRGPRDLWDRIDTKYPTSACAGLTCPDWSELAPGSAELISYDVPRG